MKIGITSLFKCRVDLHWKNIYQNDKKFDFSFEHITVLCLKHLFQIIEKNISCTLFTTS